MSGRRFDGQVLNHKGEPIFITYETYKRFRKFRVADESGAVIKAMVWNKTHDMWQFTKLAVSLLDLYKHKPEFKHNPLAAVNPSRIGEGGPGKDSGRPHQIYAELGPDLSGMRTMDRKTLNRLKTKLKERDPDLPEGYVWVNNRATRRVETHE